MQWSRQGNIFDSHEFFRLVVQRDVLFACMRNELSHEWKWTISCRRLLSMISIFLRAIKSYATVGVTAQKLINLNLYMTIGDFILDRIRYSNWNFCSCRKLSKYGWKYWTWYFSRGIQFPKVIFWTAYELDWL